MISISALRGLFYVWMDTIRVDGSPAPQPNDTKRRKRLQAAIDKGLVRRGGRLIEWYVPTQAGWLLMDYWDRKKA